MKSIYALAAFAAYTLCARTPSHACVTWLEGIDNPDEVAQMLLGISKGGTLIEGYKWDLINCATEAAGGFVRDDTPDSVGGSITIFTEGFQNPALPLDMDVGVPTGMVNFENLGWEILNNDPIFGVGIFLTNKAPLALGGSQALGLGGGQSSGSSASIMIAGFSGVFLPSIEFDYTASGTETQGTTITITDPANGDNVLFSATVFGNGLVNSPFDFNPIGDFVELTITQAGISTNSDTAVDNIAIFASPIPEPGRAALLALGLCAALSRRRRS